MGRRRTVTIGKEKEEIVLTFSSLLSKEIASRGFQSAKIEYVRTSALLYSLELKLEFFRKKEGRKIRRWGKSSPNFHIALPKNLVSKNFLKMPLLLRIGGARWISWNILYCWFPRSLEIKIQNGEKEYIGFAFLVRVQKVRSEERRLYFSGNLSTFLAKVQGMELIARAANAFIFAPKRDCFLSSCKECSNPRCFPLYTPFPRKGGKQKYIQANLLFPEKFPTSQGKVFKYGEWLGVEF